MHALHCNCSATVCDDGVNVGLEGVSNYNCLLQLGVMHVEMKLSQLQASPHKLTISMTDSGGMHRFNYKKNKCPLTVDVDSGTAHVHDDNKFYTYIMYISQ